MDWLALILVIIAAILAAPVVKRGKGWVVTLLLVALICQLTTVTNHLANF